MAALSAGRSRAAGAIAWVLAIAALMGFAQPAAAQFVQQGPKLVGSENQVSPPSQGTAVAVSADGNTLIVGGASDEDGTGAAWVFTRSGGVWTQQGSKLVGNGGTGGANQGSAVALSADGNTAAVGGFNDNFGAGAVWVFTRSNGVWTQQGSKLVGSGAITPVQGAGSEQGAGVALSADGNTLLVGAPWDNTFGGSNGCCTGVGAAWIFTRSNGTWTQQAKLVGTGAVGTCPVIASDSSPCPEQGYSVALSSDGATAILGGLFDNSGAGAAWVFTSSNGSWTQQAKLAANDNVGAANQGASVSLSGDGNTAILGGPADNSQAGAAWIFNRSNGSWSQQGPKLTGNDNVGAASQGYSVSLSGDGNTAIVGGPCDNPSDPQNCTAIGAAWIFTNNAGTWTQLGPKLVGTGYVSAPGSGVRQGNSVALSADANTAAVGGMDDNTDVGATWVFVQPPGVIAITPSSGPAAGGTTVTITGRNFTGATAVDFGSVAALSFTANSATSITATSPPGRGMRDVTVSNQFGSSATSPADIFTYPPVAHDFNGDGYSDILWSDTSGDLAIWEMDGGTILNPSNSGLGAVYPPWAIVGQRDFNGDGYADILWRNTSTGDVAIWEMNGTAILNPSSSGLGSVATAWSIVGTGDFNGDGYADILWRNTSTGDLSIWEMNGTTIINPSSTGLGNVPLNWTVVGVGDFNGDGKADILWRDTAGDLSIWLMNGTTILNPNTSAVGNMPTSWFVAGTGDFNGDGNSDILWQDTSGDIAIWEMNGTAILNPNTAGVGNLSTVWSVAETGDFDGNGMSDILWRDTSGDIAIWFMNGTTIASGTGLGTIPTTYTIQGTNAD
ncbi:MAG TPA: FG-GAP-like repeat-containing protein [Xanthobacteraceae bacterium]|nr:FG-GAP-like repeat-containing protein [Xanthobacteraceae bacterium]